MNWLLGKQAKRVEQQIEDASLYDLTAQLQLHKLESLQSVKSLDKLVDLMNEYYKLITALKNIPEEHQGTKYSTGGESGSIAFATNENKFIVIK